MSSEPIRQPANDPIAFDISKRSPEQIANLFARWKEQRKRLLQAPEARRRPPHLKPVPPIVHGAVEEAESAAPAPAADTERGRPVRYSASFEALLSAREPTPRVWNPDARPANLGRPHPPRQRSKTKWVLAGAASVVAVTAMAGGALWELSTGRPGLTQAGDKPDASLIASPAEAAVAPTYPMDIPMAEPFVAQATATRQADWPMRRTVDLALMKAVPVAETAHLPLMPRLKPPVPVVRTASKPAAKPTVVAQPEDAPSKAPAVRVELPLAPNVTTATVSVPVAPPTETRDDDSRSNIITGRGNDKDNFPFGSNGRVASSSSKPAGASGSGGAADPGSGSAGGSTGGSGNPGSGGTGSDPGGGTGGSDPGGGDTGGGDTGGGDAGGGDAGGGDTGGSDSGGDDSGGSDSGGDSDSGGEGGDGEGGESGESGESGSDDGGGIGGAIGGALGGLGDAIGGALGGGKGDANGGKDKSEDKDKSD